MAFLVGVRFHGGVGMEYVEDRNKHAVKDDEKLNEMSKV